MASRTPPRTGRASGPWCEDCRRRAWSEHPGHIRGQAACARLSATPWFFLVDADNWIRDGFDFAVPADWRRRGRALGRTNPFN